MSGSNLATGGLRATVANRAGYQGRGRDRKLVLEIGSADSSRFDEIASALDGAIVAFRVDEDGCLIAAVRGRRFGERS